MLRAADKKLQVGQPLGDVLRRYEPCTLNSEGELTSGTGTLITSNATANVEGNWVQIVASTPKQADGFILQLTNGTVTITDSLVDIGIGGSGSEVAIVSNVLFTGGGSEAGPATAYFPIPIPPGTRIAARSQSADASMAPVGVVVTLVDGGVARSMRRRVATTYGADTSDSGGTAVDAGAVLNTKGAWAQLSASVTSSFDQCIVCIGQRNNATNTAQNMMLDIGVGAALSETVVIPDICYRVQTIEEIVPKWVWCPVNVKAGERLAARIQSSQSAETVDRVVDIVVIGFS